MPAKMKFDKVMRSEVLLTAQDFAAAGGKTTRKEGRAAARFGRNAAHLIKLAPPRRDLSDFDQLELHLWVPEGTEGRLSGDIRLASRTEGLPENDAFWFGPAMPLRFSGRSPGEAGWDVVRFPFEDFHIYGTPDGWCPVDHITLRIDCDAKAVFIGGLSGQKRRRAKGPRLTDYGLFEELDLQRLPEVGKALDAGDLKNAGSALVGHFRRRGTPRHFYGHKSRDAARFSTAPADRILSHQILGQQLPRKIDWRLNPIGYLEWRHAFNRHYFMAPLVEAYKTTGDGKYAAELDYLLSSWMEQSPEPQDTNGGGDPSWETLSTAVRIYGLWLEAWFTLQDSPSFRPETRIAMLKSMWAHAEHLMKYQGGANNWIVVESRVVALLGMLFPEFINAGLWHEEGIARLTRELKRQVYPDGAQYEVSPGYHSMSALGFCDVYRVAKMNGIVLDPLFDKRLEGMFDYTMQVMRPDGTWPSLNDSGGCRGSGRKGFIELGAELFDRPDMLWVANGGKSGKRPSGSSRVFEDAGIAVMRSGWGPGDKYLVFDGGPFSAAHQHEDKLSFELYSDGTLFIVDPGITSYMREPWTHYYRSPEAHNTVLVDGKGQDRRGRQTREQHIRSVRGENLYFTGRAFDFVQSEYAAGFPGIKEDILHRRSVLFLKPDYWLIWDEILGKSRRSVQGLYHFMPMRLQVDEEAGRVRTDRLGKANLEMIVVPKGDELDISIVTGQGDPATPGQSPTTPGRCPVQGWISDGEDIPAPVVVLGKRQRLPLRYGVAFIPYATGNSAGVAVELLKTSGGVTAFRLASRDGRADTFMIRGGSKSGGAGGLATDAGMVVVRRDAKGKVLSACRIGGSYLEVDGKGLRMGKGTAAESLSR